jgi:hypothetical protein
MSGCSKNAQNMNAAAANTHERIVSKSSVHQAATAISVASGTKKIILHILRTTIQKDKVSGIPSGLPPVTITARTPETVAQHKSATPNMMHPSSLIRTCEVYQSYRKNRGAATLDKNVATHKEKLVHRYAIQVPLENETFCLVSTTISPRYTNKNKPSLLATQTALYRLTHFSPHIAQ